MHDEISFLEVLENIRDELARIADALEVRFGEDLDFEEDEEEDEIETLDDFGDAIADIDAGVDDVFDRFDKENDQ